MVAPTLLPEWLHERLARSAGRSLAYCYALFAATLFAEAAHADIVDYRNGVVLIGGHLDNDDAERFEELSKRHKIDYVVVASPGGRAEVAIQIAGAVNELSIPVEVEGFCLSSCANYILPAASEVRIRSGSAIGYHGLISSSDHTVPLSIGLRCFFGHQDSCIEAQRRKNLQRVAAMEARFFAQLGTDVGRFDDLQQAAFEWAAETGIASNHDEDLFWTPDPEALYTCLGLSVPVREVPLVPNRPGKLDGNYDIRLFDGPPLECAEQIASDNPYFH